MKIKMQRLQSPWGARGAGRACEEGAQEAWSVSHDQWEPRRYKQQDPMLQRQGVYNAASKVQ